MFNEAILAFLVLSIVVLYLNRIGYLKLVPINEILIKTSESTNLVFSIMTYSFSFSTFQENGQLFRRISDILCCFFLVLFYLVQVRDMIRLRQ